MAHRIKRVGDISPNGILSRDPVLSPQTNRKSNGRPRMYDLSLCSVRSSSIQCPTSGVVSLSHLSALTDSVMESSPLSMDGGLNSVSTNHSHDHTLLTATYNHFLRPTAPKHELIF